MNTTTKTETVTSPGLPDITVPARPVPKAARINARLAELQAMRESLSATAGDLADLAVQEALGDVPADRLAGRRAAADKLLGVARDIAALEQAVTAAEKEDADALAAWRKLVAELARKTWFLPALEGLREAVAVAGDRLAAVQQVMRAGSGYGFGDPTVSWLADHFADHAVLGQFVKGAVR